MNIINSELERLHSHRFALEIIHSVPELRNLWLQIEKSILSISDDELMETFTSINAKKKKGKNKSLAPAINFLLDKRLRDLDWIPQSDIFTSIEIVGSMVEANLDQVSDEDDGLYSVETSRDRGRNSTWTLDFSKSVSLPDGKKTGMAVEVAFNHAEAAAWNLVKPVIASEINDARVKTNIGEGIGVVIVASAGMKYSGNFDGATGDFRRYLKTLNAMRSQLTSPILLVPLDAPESFHIQRKSKKQGVSIEGTIKMH